MPDRSDFPGYAGFVPLDQLTTPREGYAAVNRWWAVDPARGAIFYSRDRWHWSPQSNTHEGLHRRLTARLWPGAEIVHVPVAYLGQTDHEGSYTGVRQLLAGITEAATAARPPSTPGVAT